MKLLKNFAAVAGAVAAAATFSLPVQAAATIQYTGGQFATFTGFDWASNGTAFTTGFAPVANQAFDLTYFSHATALLAPNTVPSGMDLIADGNSTGFNWTIVANLKERVSECNSAGTLCSFQIDAGSTFDVYYNANFNANTAAGSLGTGYLNGIKILSGTVDITGPDGGGVFVVAGAGGTGSSSLLATVTYTNSAYIAPDLLGSVFGTQLNLGNRVTEWTNPGGFNGTAFTGGAGNIVFQADGNQTFTVAQVPEPSALALAAIALLGVGAATRRRGKQV